MRFLALLLLDMCASVASVVMFAVSVCGEYVGGSGIVSSAADVLGVSLVRVMRRVGCCYVCVSCKSRLVCVWLSYLDLSRHHLLL